MRCLILGALVLIASAGCGGPSENPDLRGNIPTARKSAPTLDAAQSAVARRYALVFGEDAVDSCVAAFEDDNLVDHSEVDKPSAGDLAAFLCNCVHADTCL
jgi:hypothetical protein